MEIKKFLHSFWGGVIVVILVVVFGYLIWSILSSKGVSFEIVGPEEVKAGNVYEYHLIYANNSRIVLQEAEIELKVPPGVVVSGQPSKRIINFFLGEVVPKSQRTKTVKLLIAGTPNSVAEVQATFRYRPKTLSSVFEVQKKKTIVIGGSAFSLNLRFPDQVFLGQSFPLEIDWVNQSENYFNNVEVRIDWPEGYTFQEAEPTVASGNNVWNLGYLVPHSSGVIGIRGFASGNEGETKKVVARLGINENGVFLPLAQTEAFFTLTKNPLLVQLTINNQSDTVASLGQLLKFDLNVINKYPSSLRNLVVKVVFSDKGVIDWTTLQAPQALFSSRLKTLIWDGSKVDALYVLTPNAKTHLSFSVKLKKHWPLISQAQENTLIEVQTEVKSSNVPEGASITEIPKAITVNTIKLQSHCQVDIASYFRDAPSGIANQGHLPLRVGEPTDFTIHWKIYNTYNELKNVQIKTTLPAGVEFTSQIAGNYGDNLPTFDENTREFVWNIPTVAAGSGILTAAPELIFQIRVTPSLSQLHKSVQLIGETSFSAVDSWTHQEINLVYPPVFSNNLTDKTVSPVEGIVIQ